MQLGKEKVIRQILEKYEKAYSFSFSLVGYNGLLISNGFLKTYLDQDIVTAQGSILIDFVTTFVKRVIGEVHIPENSSLRKYMEVAKLPKRKFEIRNVVIELKLDNYLTKDMERYDIIVSPLSFEDSYILLILDKSSNRTIKLDLDLEKQEIEEALLGKKG